MPLAVIEGVDVLWEITPTLEQSMGLMYEYWPVMCLNMGGAGPYHCMKLGNKMFILPNDVNSTDVDALKFRLLQCDTFYDGQFQQDS